MFACGTPCAAVGRLFLAEPARTHCQMMADGIRHDQVQQKAHGPMRKSQKIQVLISPVEDRAAVTQQQRHRHEEPVRGVRPAKHRGRDHGSRAPGNQGVEPREKVPVQKVLLEDSPRQIRGPGEKRPIEPNRPGSLQQKAGRQHDEREESQCRRELPRHARKLPSRNPRRVASSRCKACDTSIKPRIPSHSQ